MGQNLELFISHSWKKATVVEGDKFGGVPLVVVNIDFIVQQFSHLEVNVHVIVPRTPTTVVWMCSIGSIPSIIASVLNP